MPMDTVASRGPSFITQIKCDLSLKDQLWGEGTNPWREELYWNAGSAENQGTGFQSHLGVKVEAQPLCCHVGAPLLGAVTQHAPEREVQQVSGGVVRHAGQAPRLKAHTTISRDCWLSSAQGSRG